MLTDYFSYKRHFLKSQATWVKRTCQVSFESTVMPGITLNVQLGVHSSTTNGPLISVHTSAFLYKDIPWSGMSKSKRIKIFTDLIQTATMLSKRDVTVFTHNCNVQYLFQHLASAGKATVQSLWITGWQL